MRTLAVVGFLVLCMAVVVFSTSPAFALDKKKFYVEGEAGGSFVDFQSGGWNTEGGFPNTGEKSGNSVVAGVRVGVKLLDFLRTDIGYSYRSCLGFTTNSFMPPTPTFFYRTRIDNTNTLMLSLFYEPVHFKKFTPYVGAGVGSTWMKGYTNDTVVAGSRSQTNFAWQGEAGIQYGLTDHITFKLGYRYIDMGTLKINLANMSNGTPAGNFKGDLTANEVICGVRYSF